MPPGVYPRPSLAARLWARVEKTATCWLWQGARSRNGYGKIATGFGHRAGGWILVHRAALQLLGIEIPPDREVDHVCHVRHCVNPNHLRIVTHLANMRNRKGADANHQVHAG